MCEMCEMYEVNNTLCNLKGYASQDIIFGYIIADRYFIFVSHDL